MHRLSLLALLLPTALAVPRFPTSPGAFRTGVTQGPLSTGASDALYAQHNSTLVGPFATGTAPQPSTLTHIPQRVSSATEAPVSGSVTVLDRHSGGGNAKSSTVKEGSVSDNSNASNAVNAPGGVNTESPSTVIVPGGNNTESPVTGNARVSECGPATVTVTATANTVTVTVGVDAAPETLPNPTSATLEATSSIPVPLRKFSAETPTGSATVIGTESLSPKTEVPSASSVALYAFHSYKHASLHKSSSSILSTIRFTSVPQVLAPSSNPAPETRVSEAPVASSVSSNSPVPETSQSEAPVVQAPSSAQKPSITPVVTPKIAHAPLASPTPILTSAVQEATSSTLPILTFAAQKPASSSLPPPASSPAPAPKPNTNSHQSSPDVTPRGLVYNTATLTNLFSSSSAISWAYNWDSQPGGTLSPNIQFVPQFWGPIPVHTDHWKTNADKALAAGSTHFLGFNEPDIAEQANLLPPAAVTAWKTYLEPYAGKVKLGSPSVCNGPEPTKGLQWLSTFLDGCSSCTIDFIAIHWYGLANDEGVKDFKDHVAKAHVIAKGRSVWITEFQPSGSVEQQADFMAKILPWLDDKSQSGVERYAYFQVDNILASDGKLTKLGSVYAA